MCNLGLYSSQIRSQTNSLVISHLFCLARIRTGAIELELIKIRLSETLRERERERERQIDRQREKKISIEKEIFFDVGKRVIHNECSF